MALEQHGFELCRSTDTQILLKRIYPTLLKDLWLVEFPDVEVRPRGADSKVIRGFSQREESWCS